MNPLLHVIEFTSSSEQTLDYMIVYNSNYVKRKNKLTFNTTQSFYKKIFKNYMIYL